MAEQILEWEQAIAPVGILLLVVVDGEGSAQSVRVNLDAGALTQLVDQLVDDLGRALAPSHAPVAHAVALTKPAARAVRDHVVVRRAGDLPGERDRVEDLVQLVGEREWVHLLALLVEAGSSPSQVEITPAQSPGGRATNACVDQHGGADELVDLFASGEEPANLVVVDRDDVEEFGGQELASPDPLHRVVAALAPALLDRELEEDVQHRVAEVVGAIFPLGPAPQVFAAVDALGLADIHVGIEKIPERVEDVVHILRTRRLRAAVLGQFDVEEIEGAEEPHCLNLTPGFGPIRVTFPCGRAFSRAFASPAGALVRVSARRTSRPSSLRSLTRPRART